MRQRIRDVMKCLVESPQVILANHITTNMDKKMVVHVFKPSLVEKCRLFFGYYIAVSHMIYDEEDIDIGLDLRVVSSAARRKLSSYQ